MSDTGERIDRGIRLLHTIFQREGAIDELGPDFNENAFEPEEQRQLFRAINEVGPGTGNWTGIADRFPHLASLLPDVIGSKIYNGELSLVAASLMDKRKLKKLPDEPKPEVKDAEPSRISLPNLNEYLGGVEWFLRRYVAFQSEHEPTAIALWVAHSWIVERFEVSPILAVTSAEMRSGKTRVLDCLQLLTPNPFRTVLPSEAVTYSILSQRPRPTFFLDECDTIFSSRPSERTEGLRAIFNSGNMQGTPVFRVNFIKGARTVETFDCFGPKVIAGIGQLPSTIADRSVQIRMRRRTTDEPIAKFRRKIAKLEAHNVYFDWAGVTLETNVSVPDELNDRAADSWEPLLAIADAAGGDWPIRARRAAIALTEEEDNLTVGMKLLGDIQEVFRDDDHIETGTLLERLHELEASPWAEWYGKPLTARGLAKMLEPYRVRPVLRRLASKPIRGYFRTDFEDVWKRYAPSNPPVTNVTSVTGDISEQGVTGVTDVTVRTERELEDEQAEIDMRLALQDGD